MSSPVGGHLRACAAKLKGLGLRVEVAVCGGKTLYDQSEDPFEVFKEVLDDFEP